MKNPKLKKLINEQRRLHLESFLSDEVEFLNVRDAAFLYGGMLHITSECPVKTGPCNDLTSCGSYVECSGKCGIKI